MSIKEDFLKTFTQELIINSAPAYVLEKLESERRRDFLKKMNISSDNEIKIKVNEFASESETPMPEEFREIKKEFGVVKSDGMEKIVPLLKNEFITEVECLGPEKFLIIHKGVETIPLKMSLDKHEIESILNTFAEKARIPRIGGTFKAILNNLVINAIDSEFGGPRFIITKIHPQESEYLEG